MELPAPLELGSTFGWHCALPHRTTRMPSRVPGIYVASVAIPADPTRTIPLITFGVADALACAQLQEALSGQSLPDTRVLECPQGVASLQQTFGRYVVIVAGTAVGSLAHLAREHEHLMLRLALVLLRYQPAMLYLAVGQEIVGVCLDRQLFVGRSVIPSSGDLTGDLHRYAACLGHVGSYRLDEPLSAPISQPPPLPAATADGYWPSPLLPVSTALDRDALEKCVDACPSFLFRRDQPLWTCLANDWYEHRTVLRRYVGMEADIQIHGKVQHGWQSGCGIDGERGYKPEHFQGRFPVFVWNRRNAETARADGVEATAIGAPFVYADLPPDPGPSDRSLLCFPYHSVPEYPLQTDWRQHADRLHDVARTHGFSRVTVCLHHFDFDNTETRDTLREAGVAVVTAGGALEPFFLARLIHLIREHAAVTSDRICTAGLYAEALGRPFFLSGEPLRSDPPDPDFGLGADRAWIRREMPEFLMFTGQTHRSVAMRELGEEYKRSRAELRRLLYGWMLDDA